MISKETEAEVLRLYHAEKWRIGTIAAQLGLHHTTVQRVLRQTGVELKASCLARLWPTRSSRFWCSSSRSTPGCVPADCSRWCESAAIQAALITSGASFRVIDRVSRLRR